MQSFGPTIPAPEPEGTIHVALFAEDGSVLFHEEVPASRGGPPPETLRVRGGAPRPQRERRHSSTRAPTGRPRATS